MKKILRFLPAVGIIAVLFIAATTMEDFFLPGSQIGQSGNIETPDRCDNCHGGYNQAIEPAFNWRGSMMSQAARDPLFYACLAIANQDAPGSGDMCLRCHTPDGWLNGRCVPTDGSALNNNDRQGVQCDFCHKMVKPTPLGTNPYPDSTLYKTSVYGNVAYNLDQAYLTTIIPIPGTSSGGIFIADASSANGMYIADANNAKRGPFSDATGRHQMIYSPFHRDAAHCGTCHDVSNPAFSKTSGTDIFGNPEYALNATNAPHEDFNLRNMFPVERTYSEWKASIYNAPGTLNHKTCQDCHMKDVTGKAASMKDARLRTDMPLHDMTGGNTFTPKMIKSGKWASEVNPAALDAGIVRSQAQLKSATTMSVAYDALTKEAIVTVTNNTGHKFPTGYPEGRRAWIHLVAYNGVNKVFESGAYDYTNAVITDYKTAKVYHCEPGISEEVAALKGLTAGPSFHFAINSMIYFDNRIPPAGATNAELIAMQSPTVNYIYGDNQNWDVTKYPITGTVTKVEAKLYYQTTTKEYVEFLRDENKTNSAGTELYNLWVANDKSAPELINSATWGSDPVVTNAMTAEFVSVGRNIAKTGTTGFAIVKVTTAGTPLSGAVVSANYTGPNSGTITGTTGSNGTVTLVTKAFKNPSTLWCFTITNVTKAQVGNNLYTYTIPKPLLSMCEQAKSATIPDRMITENILSVYPNPVHGKARLDYTVAEPGLVRIAVYNNVGQQLTTLVDKTLAEGDYSAEWDGSGYPDGVYICRMTTGNKVISKTIILKK